MWIDLPRRFRADPTDAEVLRVAITLRAGQPGIAVPDEQFVAELHRELAARANQRDAPPSFRTIGARQGTLEEMTRPRDSASRPRRILRRRFPMAIGAAAAMFLVASTIRTTKAVDRHSQAALVQKAVSSANLRSGELLAVDGRPPGWTYAYAGDPSWMVMNLHASGLSGTYICELEMVNGTAVPVGTLVMQHGSGQWALTLKGDIGQLRAARLVTPTGSTLANATFS